MPALSRRAFLVMSASIVAAGRGVGSVFQSAPPPVSWSEAGQALSSVLDVASSGWTKHAPAVQTAMAGVRRNVTFLLSRWRETEGNPVPRGYVDGLRADAELFRAARPITPLPAPKEKQVLETADDIRLKAEQCQQSSVGWAELVAVSVKTVDPAQKPATGQEVWYCPRGWADVPSKWQKFPKLSTPTVEHLAPGMYMFRIGTGPAEARRVGGDGLPQASFDLIVKR